MNLARLLSGARVVVCGCGTFVAVARLTIKHDSV